MEIEKPERISTQKYKILLARGWARIENFPNFKAASFQLYENIVKSLQPVQGSDVRVVQTPSGVRTLYSSLFQALFKKELEKMVPLLRSENKNKNEHKSLRFYLEKGYKSRQTVSIELRNVVGNFFGTKGSKHISEAIDEYIKTHADKVVSIHENTVTKQLLPKESTLSIALMFVKRGLSLERIHKYFPNHRIEISPEN